MQDKLPTLSGHVGVHAGAASTLAARPLCPSLQLPLHPCALSAAPAGQPALSSHCIVTANSIASILWASNIASHTVAVPKLLFLQIVLPKIVSAAQ